MTAFELSPSVSAIALLEGAGAHPIQAPAQPPTQAIDAVISPVKQPSSPAQSVPSVSDLSVVAPPPVAASSDIGTMQSGTSQQSRTLFAVPEAMDRAIQVLVEKVLNTLLNTSIDARTALSDDADRTPLASVFA